MKTNLDFDILQLYFTKKFAEILIFKTGSTTFLDVLKICKKRCIKYNSKFINFTKIKHALFSEMAFKKLFIMKQ